MQGRQRCRTGWNGQTGEITDERDQHHADRHQLGVALTRHQHTRTDGAPENRQERSHLYQRIASHQLILGELLRQDRVLDRTKQRRLGAHAEQHRKQYR